MATLYDFDRWLRKDLGRFTEGSHIEELPSEHDERRIRIYTETNCYSIKAVERRSADQSCYLGCIAESRKPRAGEDRTRGNDLAEGPLHIDTWRRILADIVSYELVRVHRPPRPEEVAA